MGSKTVAFVANKGGVGKTRQSILLANCLGKLGYKTGLLDMDFNNSSTGYYAKADQANLIKHKNIAVAMANPEHTLSNFAIPSDHENVSFVASSRYLCDLRAVSVYRLKEIISNTSEFDYIIIDCQPNYDNLTLNAINASDWIITPVLKDTDSKGAADFLQEKLIAETNKYDNWFITINRYNHNIADAKTGKQKEYVDMYLESFQGHITPRETWFPDTPLMNDIKDRQLLLAEKEKIPGTVCQPQLYSAVLNLAECFLDAEITTHPEAF
jgi:chromosome segregation ATPase